MSDAQRAALTAERAGLVRKLAKRRDEPGFATNVAEIEARVAAIELALSAE